MKKFISLILCCTLVATLGACGKKAEVKPNIEVKQDKTELKAKGYKVYNDTGLAFKLSDVWKNYDDNITLSSIGDSEDKEQPIYGGLAYGFISNELIKEYEDIKNNEKDKELKKKKLSAVWEKVKPFMSLVVFRKEKLPKEDSQIVEITKFKNNEKVKEVDNFVFYMSYGDFDDLGLSDEGKKGYKDLYDEIKNVKDTLICSKPITPDEAFKNIGKIEFKLKDLDGKDVDSSEIFKKYKVTMINIWGTFCGPCINEMPDLQALYKEMEPQGVNLIGIIGDTPDPDNEVLAKKIYKEKGVTFTSVIPDKALKDKVISNIAGYPTTIFVDSEGKIIGETVTGSRSKADYKDIIEKITKK